MMNQLRSFQEIEILKKAEKRSFRLLKLLMFVSFCLVGCKVMERKHLPERTELPAHFRSSSDTLSMGDIPYNEFFEDTHLIALIGTALENNLDLQIARQRIQIAQAEYLMSRNALFPSLHGRATANIGNLNNQMIGQTIPDRTVQNLNQNYFIGFQSAWEVDIWGRLQHMRKAAYHRFLASQQAVQLLRTMVVAEVARLYYDLVTLDNEMEIVDRNIELQETALEVINIQKMAGRATELAVQRARAQLLSTRALRAGIDQRRIESENLLNLILGRYPQPITRGAAVLVQRLPEPIMAGIPSDVLLRRPDVQEAQQRLAGTEADIEAARAAFLPSLILSPYLGLNAPVPAMLMSAPGSIAAGMLASLLTPVFNRRIIRSNYEIATARAFEATYDYQRVLIDAYQEVMNDLYRIQNFDTLYRLKQQEVDVLQNAVSTSNILFTTGYANYLEVITAQSQVLEAELQLTNIRREMFFSVIELYRALGGS